MATPEYIEQLADHIADYIEKGQLDITDQSGLLVRVAEKLDMVAVVFNQNDCDEDLELDAIDRDLRDVLITRGNEFIAACQAGR